MLSQSDQDNFTSPSYRPMVTAELLAAERALSRLVQQLADAPSDLADILRANSFRREVWASLQLDENPVHLEDIAVGQMNLALLPGSKQDGIDEALGMLRAAEAMRRGLTAADTREPKPSRPEPKEVKARNVDEVVRASDAAKNEIERILAATRAAKADLNSFLDGIKMPEPVANIGGPTLLTPLSEEWLTKAWTMALGQPDEDEKAAIARAATDIATALSSRPGLTGVASALRRLHAEEYWPRRHRLAPQQYRDEAPEAAVRLDEVMLDRQRPGPGWRFARMISPWLIERGCELHDAAPWCSEALLLRRSGYAAAAVMREGEWERWLTGALADGWILQLRRLHELRNRLETWRRGCDVKETPGKGRGRRPRRGGPLAVVSLIAAQPMVTAEWLTSKLGISIRSAQTTLAEMEKLGVVREVTGGHTHRIYEAVG